MGNSSFVRASGSNDNKCARRKVKRAGNVAVNMKNG
jgi:hypothetical protein